MQFFFLLLILEISVTVFGKKNTENITYNGIRESN